MKLSEILIDRFKNIKRGGTFISGDDIYTFYDFHLYTNSMGMASYRVSKRIFLKLNKKDKSFEILDKEYSDVLFKSKRFKLYKSPFNIYKNKLINKLKEKYGDEYLLKIFNHTNNEVVSDVVEYVDNKLFFQNKMLFFDNKLYIFRPNILNKNSYMERVYKLKKLQNKLAN